MQHGDERVTSRQLTAAVSHQLVSGGNFARQSNHINPPAQPIHPFQHHSRVSSFQTTFSAAVSPRSTSDPRSQSRSRPAIPQRFENPQYHTHFPTHITPSPNNHHYPPYPLHANDPYFHQTRYATDVGSTQPTCGPFLYVQPVGPTHAPYYPYQTPPSAPTEPNPNQIHQIVNPTIGGAPAAIGQSITYPEMPMQQILSRDHAVGQTSSAHGHAPGDMHTFDPGQSPTSNLSFLKDRSGPWEDRRALPTLPPLRGAPPHPSNHSFYTSTQSMPNTDNVPLTSQAVLPTAPYPPSPYIPQMSTQRLPQIPDGGRHYNDPYHHNLRIHLPSETQYQRASRHEVQWQTHLVPAAQVHTGKASGDDRIAVPSYYVGSDGVTSFVGQQVTPRKKRLQWTPELHAKFVKAVEEFGVETAVPKLLLQAMNVPGLTRENVASHLQKYRESVRKKKLELERAQGGVERVSAKCEKPIPRPIEAGRDEGIDIRKREVEEGVEKNPAEEVTIAGRKDSEKRMLGMEREEDDVGDSKRQKTEATMPSSLPVSGAKVTEQEVESYASVRARVDEALQLQTSSRDRPREGDIT